MVQLKPEIEAIPVDEPIDNPILNEEKIREILKWLKKNEKQLFRLEKSVDHTWKLHYYK